MTKPRSREGNLLACFPAGLPENRGRYRTPLSVAPYPVVLRGVVGWVAVIPTALVAQSSSRTSGFWPQWYQPQRTSLLK
jgi:hypothetical protein